MANLTPQIKAAAISAAFYTATGIQPQVVYPEGKPPRIYFTRADILTLRKKLDETMKKKSDIDIDILPIVAPAVLKRHGFSLLLVAGALFVVGYLSGRIY